MYIWHPHQIQLTPKLSYDNRSKSRDFPTIPYLLNNNLEVLLIVSWPLLIPRSISWQLLITIVNILFLAIFFRLDLSIVWYGEAPPRSCCKGFHHIPFNGGLNMTHWITVEYLTFSSSIHGHVGSCWVSNRPWCTSTIQRALEKVIKQVTFPLLHICTCAFSIHVHIPSQANGFFITGFSCL